MAAISIALATYNGRKYLEAQLRSLAAQTLSPAELRIADDGSSDGTLEIIRKFERTAPFPVHVTRNAKRLGYRANFVHLAETCTSELIAFCDQDDIWDPAKLDTIRQRFEDRDVLLVYHNGTLIDETGTRIGTLFEPRAMKFRPLAIGPWTIVPGHALAIRRTLLRFGPLHARSIDPYSPDEVMPHDLWYLFWASVLGDIVYTPEHLAQYRQHRDNASGWPHLGWRSYVSDHVANAARYVSGESIGARNRLDLLLASSEFLSPPEIPRIEAAVRYYRELCVRSDLRLAVYRAPTLAARASALLGLLRQGAYLGRASQTLGAPALLLDAAVGLPFRRRM